MKDYMLKGAIVVSAIALIGFIAISALVFTANLAPDLKSLVIPVVVTAWVGLAGTAVGFWCGSSMESAQKTEMLQPHEGNKNENK